MKFRTLSRLNETRKSLQEVLRKILDINKVKKKIYHAPDMHSERKEIEQELKVLNKVAEQKARLIRLYERNLENNNSRTG